MSQPFIPHGEPRCGKCNSRSLKYDYTLGGQCIVFCEFCKTMPETLSFPSYFDKNPQTYTNPQCYNCHKILHPESISTLCQECLLGLKYDVETNKANPKYWKIYKDMDYITLKQIKDTEKKPKPDKKKINKRRIILD